jgi:hypothetical protein
VILNSVSTTYCTAKLNSLGCMPLIGSSGVASASASSGFTITGSNVRNKKTGLLFYGITGTQATPFQGGFHCVKTPTKRTPSVNSGGSVFFNDCTGVYSIDFNTYARGLIPGSPPLASLSQPGQIVHCQWWGRDPGLAAPNNTTLSNAMTFMVCE